MPEDVYIDQRTTVMNWDVEREFELRFLRERGTAFQDLFADLMERAYPADFTRVRPHGNTGDLKCDGYLGSSQSVFQVYGPEDVSRLRRLLLKIRDDFDGARSHWSGRMTRWVFVHNSRGGLPARAVQCLQDLNKRSAGVKIEHWGFAELLQVVKQLTSDDAASLFPHARGSAPLTALPPRPREVKPYLRWIKSHLVDPPRPTHLAVLQHLHFSPLLVTRDAVAEHKRREDRVVADHLSQSARHPLDESHREPAIGLRRALRHHHRLLIVADAGSGKSTFLRRFARNQASVLERRGFDRLRGWTPVLVDLWRFGPDRPLIEMVVDSVNRAMTSTPRDQLFAAIDRGYVSVLCDGLDEVPAEHRRECLAQILAFCDRYPLAPLAMTSRPFPNPPEHFSQLVLQPLPDSAIDEALRFSFRNRQLNGNDDRHRSWHGVPVLSAEGRQICRNPLMLAMVANLLASGDELPPTRYETFERFLSWMLDWEIRKGNLSTAAAATVAVEEVGYAMCRRDRSRLSNAEWIRTASQAMKEALPHHSASDLDAANVLRVLLSTGLLFDIGGEIEFNHRSFMEFAAAAKLKRMSDPIADPLCRRKGIAQFLSGGLDTVEPLLAQHLQFEEDVQELRPLLDEAAKSGHPGGRFEDLKDCMDFAAEIGVDIDWLRGSEADQFIERVRNLVQTALSFGPKAISVLKDATHGIAWGVPWPQSQDWFVEVVKGLVALNWPGATMHLDLVRAGLFEKIDLFCDDGSEDGSSDRLHVFEEYWNAASKDRFDQMSDQLAALVRILLPRVQSRQHEDEGPTLFD